MKPPTHKIIAGKDKVVITIEHFGETVFTIEPDGYGIMIHGQYTGKAGAIGEEGITIRPIDENTIEACI